MTKWILRSAVVALVTLAALGLAPSASAINGPSILWYDAYWSTPCSGSGWGAVTFSYEEMMPAGYTVRNMIAQVSPTYGDWLMESEHTFPAFWFQAGDATYGVPFDGSFERHLDLYAPDGSLLSTASFYANCVTGELRVMTSEIYAIHEPDPAHRVQATVLVDTAVYSLPDPSTALGDTLLAGQDWFVVGETTGTDGQLWYEVFVGGAHNAYVPASTLYLPYPLPD